MSLEETIDKLEIILKRYSLTCKQVQKQANEVHLYFDSDGIIRVVKTKRNGITLCSDLGKNQAVGVEILKIFDSEYGSQRVHLDIEVFRFSSNEFAYIKKALLASLNECRYTVKIDNCKNYCELRVSNSTETVLITISPKGFIVVEGKSWIFWRKICNWIETYTKRLMEKSENTYVETIYEKASSMAKKELGSAFNYLAPHSREYIISCYLLLNQEITNCEYSFIIMPAAKMLEGYLKQLCQNWIPSIASEVNKDNFSFSQFRMDPKLKKYKMQVRFQKEVKDPKVVKAMEEVYSCYRRYRHPYFHNKTETSVVKSIDSLQEAKAIVDTIVATVKRTYLVVEKAKLTLTGTDF